MSLLAHDVEAKRKEREELAQKMAEWEAKHGKPECQPPTVRKPDEKPLSLGRTWGEP